MQERHELQPEFLQDPRSAFPEIIGQSEVMRRVLESVYKIARSEGSVLITGESGTGKELIASAIHRLSPRAHGRFVPLNCSAIPESLLESELFGHEKGAFTGAVQRRSGHFELADGGTLFLDEIGDMTRRLQSKLLRVLQDKQFTTVGGGCLKRTNVRIIAATNVDLEKAVEEGQFRLDLFYRLNVLPVALPSLRERRGDIPELLQHFLKSSNRSSNASCSLGEDVVRCLTDHAWPGNIRELQNLVERLVIIKHQGCIELLDLPSEYRNLGSIALSTATSTLPLGSQIPSPIKPTVYDLELPSVSSVPQDGFDMGRYIEDLENRLIRDALERTNHNKNQAAKILGMNRTTLVEKIKKRGIARIETDPTSV